MSLIQVLKIQPGVFTDDNILPDIHSTKTAKFGEEKMLE
jgi:hypothetical protein